MKTSVAYFRTVKNKAVIKKELGAEGSGAEGERSRFERASIAMTMTVAVIAMVKKIVAVIAMLMKEFEGCQVTKQSKVVIECSACGCELMRVRVHNPIVQCLPTSSSVYLSHYRSSCARAHVCVEL